MILRIDINEKIKLKDLFKVLEAFKAMTSFSEIEVGVSFDIENDDQQIVISVPAEEKK